MDSSIDAKSIDTVDLFIGDSDIIANLSLRESDDDKYYLIGSGIQYPNEDQLTQFLAAEELLHAAAVGNICTLQHVLTSGANLEARDLQYGQTPLLVAAHHGHINIVQYLLSKGADIEAKDQVYGRTPLLWARAHCDVDVVQCLLGSGADINATEHTMEYFDGPILTERAFKWNGCSIISLAGYRVAEVIDDSPTSPDNMLPFGRCSDHDEFESVKSDSLSISESSEEPEIYPSYSQDDNITYALRKTLDQLFQKLNTLKRSLKAINNQATQSDTRGGGMNSFAASSSTLSSTRSSCPSFHEQLGQKHQRAKETSDEGTEEVSLECRSVKKLKSQSQILACPFWKENPSNHQRCGRQMIKKIKYVKQHLRREHTPSFYCEKCFRVFSDDESHQNHVVHIRCQRSPNSRLSGITHSQRDRLRMKSNPALTEEGQWFVIWDVIFPGQKRPFSAYVDPSLSADLCLFREHWQNTGQETLLNVLRSHDWGSLSDEEQEVQGRRILAAGLDRIFQDWLSSRRSAGFSDLATEVTSVADSLCTATDVGVTPEADHQIQMSTPASDLELDLSNTRISVEELTGLDDSRELLDEIPSIATCVEGTEQALNGPSQIQEFDTSYFWNTAWVDSGDLDQEELSWFEV